MNNSDLSLEGENEIKFISDNYKINLKCALGDGAYGKVFKGYNIKAGIEVAIKVEKDSKKSCSFNEFKILKILQGGVGIPKIFGLILGSKHKYIAMELLGRNLSDIFNESIKKFEAITIYKIAYQLIERLEYIHSKGILHRDIKINNILTGKGEQSNIIFLVDFGLSKEYLIGNTFKHISFRNNKCFLRTSYYGSLNCNKGFELSRKDDLESALFIIIYLSKGSLKWKEIKAKTKEAQIKKMIIMKENLEEICRDLPKVILESFKYIRSLKFEDKPNYNLLKKLFLEIIRSIDRDSSIYRLWI